MLKLEVKEGEANQYGDYFLRFFSSVALRERTEKVMGIPGEGWSSRRRLVRYCS